jgi:hypothetical protein
VERDLLNEAIISAAEELASQIWWVCELQKKRKG